MFSIFKKKTVVPHVRLTGVIGSAGRFKQGMDLAGQQDILKKAFSLKKISVEHLPLQGSFSKTESVADQMDVM